MSHGVSHVDGRKLHPGLHLYWAPKGAQSGSPVQVMEQNRVIAEQPPPASGIAE